MASLYRMYTLRPKSIKRPQKPKVTVVIPARNEAGNIAAAGNVADGAGPMAGMRSTFNGHDHADPQGGRVDPPNQEMA